MNVDQNVAVSQKLQNCSSLELRHNIQKRIKQTKATVLRIDISVTWEQTV